MADQQFARTSIHAAEPRSPAPCLAERIRKLSISGQNFGDAPRPPARMRVVSEAVRGARFAGIIQPDEHGLLLKELPALARAATGRRAARLSIWTAEFSKARRSRQRHTFNHWSTHKMNKDRIDGAVKQTEGAIKEAAGKLLGDANLTAEGKVEKAEGKLQNAIGGLKDTLKKL